MDIKQKDLQSQNIAHLVSKTFIVKNVDILDIAIIKWR